MQQQSDHVTNSQEWGNSLTKLQKSNAAWGNLSVLHATEALRLLQLTEEDTFVVDLAAGLGAFAFPAATELRRIHANSGKEAKLLCTDFSEALVQASELQAKVEGLRDIVECRQMDAQDLSTLKNASVDAIGCIFGAMFFPDFLKSFKEMHRVLRPGGRAAIAVWKVSSVADLMIDTATRLNEEFKLETPRPPAELIRETAFKLADEQFFADQLHAAGFEGEGAVKLFTYDGDWQGLEASDLVVDMLLTNPVMKMLYPTERRPEAEVILKRVIEERRATKRWENRSLIAVAHKLQ
ncbi:putative methyltransferase, ubiE/COQ5 family [Balamuthia mandrillaris]